VRRFWTIWRHQSQKHPSVLVLTLVALLGVALGPVLIAAGMSLIGQLVAGVAIAPLTLALYLCLVLPVGPWGDEDGGRGPGRDDGPPGEPDPPGEPAAGVDWERFEREFWADADERVPVA
jgi:hypothetical protein